LSGPPQRRYLSAMRVRILLILLATVFSLAAAETPAGKELFNGKDLAGWKITDFGGQGETEVKDGKIITKQGASLSGIQYTNAVPTNNFQITLEAQKIEGDDFFCGLTFPVKDSHCSLIVGGWGGGVVGLSSVDSLDASENETTKYYAFKKDQWHKIKVEVRSDSIKAWLDDDKVADVKTSEHHIGLRAGAIEMQVPLGLCAYQTTAAWKNIRLTPLPEK
jgi:hypothetical protein